MNKIYIKFLTRYLKKDKRKLALLVRRAMRIPNPKSQMILSIVLVDNNRIRGINKRHLKRNRITDVIAFPLEEMKDSLRPRRLCGEQGEIIVSVEKALTEARLRRIHPHQEILRYCVHGLLHLLGYDDHRREDRKRMWNKQEQILKAIRDFTNLRKPVS